MSYHNIRHLPQRARTRLAPTPSGFLHLGNVLSFAITAHFAARTGAEIYLRIDDLDRERMQDEYLEDIFETLKFLDIPWQEGPVSTQDFLKNHSQYTRLNAYEKALKVLAEEGHVFACDCSRTQVAAVSVDGRYPGTCLNKKLDLFAPNVQWRVKTRPGRVITVNRLGGTMLKATLPAHMSNFVVRRKDGVPAYQLASLIDDVEMGVDLVVRGVDLWPSTWAQLYLAGLLGKESFLDTAFVHHPLLLLADGVKMSKSAGSTSVRYMRNEGMSREAVYEEIGRLSGTTQPCRSWQELGRIIEKHFAP